MRLVSSMRLASIHGQRGFTLIEAIMVITITGIIGGMVAVFIRAPIDAYVDSARRADLTDVADTALRRVAREIGTALPNGLRTPTGSDQCIEFIPTKMGGRYRSESDGTAGSDALDFSTADTTFNMIGPQSAVAAQQIAAKDLIAVYNLGISGSNAFVLDNTSAVTATPAWNATSQETAITIAAKKYPLASASNRFHVIPAGEQVVAYVCSGVGVSASGDGQGTLYRLVKTLPYPQTAACPAVPAGTPMLATHVSACSFTYTPSVLQRSGLVSIALEVRQAGESVRLQHQVSVENTP